MFGWFDAIRFRWKLSTDASLVDYQREEILRALGRTGSRLAIRPLIDHLYLDRLSQDAAAPNLDARSSAHDRNRHRRYAAEALGNLGIPDAESIQALVRVSQSDLEPHERSSARSALTKLGWIPSPPPNSRGPVESIDILKRRLLGM